MNPAKLLFERSEREQAAAYNFGRNKARRAGLDGLAQDEYGNAGLIGLFDACRRFDPSRGVKFNSYAMRRVLGSVGDTMRQEDMLSRADRQAAQGGARMPSQVSIDAPLMDGHARQPMQDSGALDPARQAEARDLLARVVAAVPQRGRVREAFVLYFLKGLTMKEVGERLGLSESGICQMMRRARADLQQFNTF